MAFGESLKPLLKDCGEYNALMAHVMAKERFLRLPGVEIEIKMLHDSLNPAPCDTSEHEHPFYELSFMRLGSMDYFFEGRRRRLNPEGRGIFFVAPAMPHERRSEESPTLISGFQLDMKALDGRGERFVYKLAERIKAQGPFFEWSEGLGELPERWRGELLSGKPLRAEKTALLAKQFLVSFLQDNFSSLFEDSEEGLEPRGASKPRNAFLRDYALKVVDEKLNQAVSVREIADACGVSVRQLNRIVSEQGGMPLRKYVTFKKMEFAKKMLEENMLLVKDIALSLGYDDSAYFCRVFREREGVTPREYCAKASRKRSDGSSAKR